MKRCYWLAFSLLICSSISIPVRAQVTIDGTTNTTLTPSDNGVRIDGGDRAGNNLFHSFSEFSIPDGGSAAFNNAVEIENIFSRVTGGNISEINGLISANGSANLMLINPAGIVFGENASLNIGGSFMATTADSLLFESGEFSAVNPQATPVLTINRPIGLNFGDNPENIINRANSGQSRVATFENRDRVEEVTINTPIGLEVAPGKNLRLVGGNILLESGGLTAPEGRVELGGLSTPGEIIIDDSGSLVFPNNVSKADVTLSDDAEVNVSGGGGGAIAVYANNLILSEGSELFAGITENGGSSEAQAGDIVINADQSVQLIGNDEDIEGLDTVITNQVGLTPVKRGDVDSSAIGNGGSIFITTDRLELTERATVRAITFGQGNAGKIEVDANTVEMSGISEIATRVRGGANGSNGNVELNVNFLSLTDAFIVSDIGDFNRENVRTIFSDGGDVIINATDAIRMDTSERLSIILAQVQDNGVGNAGNVEINTGSLSLGELSFVLATNAGTGNAGDININATELVELKGSSSLILSELLADVVGSGGDINITAPTILMADFSKIGASALENSVGEAGDITLNAVDTLRITEGSVVDALSLNDFDSGNINLIANNLELSSGGKVVVSNESGGNAGNINLNVAKDIVINNGNPPTDTIFPQPILIQLEQETGIFANNSITSTGSGGSIFVTANSLKFADRGSISASTFSGGGGSVDLQIRDVLSLRNNSLISAEATGVGNGGNVNIDAELIIAFGNNGNGSDIVAKAADAGTGGDINISTNSILGLQSRNATPFNNTNDIDASSEFGFDGTVTINNPDVDPTAGIVELLSVPIDAESILAQDLCRVENADLAGGSSFIVTGRGGLTPTSAESLDNRDRVVNWAEVTGDVKDGVVSVPRQSKRKTVVQSQGMAIAPDGSIWLTANPRDATPQNSNKHPDCRSTS